MTALGGTTRLLMCPPQHYAVTYVINPWMDPANWARDEQALAAGSRRQWIELQRILVDLGAVIELIPPVPRLPDLVFTANAAVVLDRKALLSRFRHAERRPEEPHFETAFRALHARGLLESVQKLTDGLVLEGAGDCVWDQTRNLFWMGYGQRSDVGAAHAVEHAFGAEVVPLELVDPRFYHLDTALCALSRGEVMYAPTAFAKKARAAIRARVGPAQRVEIGMADACRLAANAVCLDDAIVLSSCSSYLRADLEERGYRVIATALPSFLFGGGSAFCLTLRLDWRHPACRPRGSNSKRRPTSPSGCCAGA
jgi:N-dimethylarginine dimethylaminohydrolase